MPLNVLVTDGDQRPALAITRSLGRRGIRVIVGEEQPVSLASSSRFCAGRVVYPSPYRDRDAFQQFLFDYVQREPLDVVMPVSDVTTSAVAMNQDSLKRFCATAVPSFDHFNMVADKAALLDHARRCGVAVPRSHVVHSGADLDRVLNDVQYPAVVKPARSRIRSGRGWIATGVHYAHNADALRRLYGEHLYLAGYPSLIQERIVGDGVGVFALFDRGAVIAEFAHRRLREKPPAGGVSVLSESVAVDREMRRDLVTLLGSIGWHGVAMLEYKQDHRTGIRYLMEVNGRFWGSLQLAVESGVDFPWLATRLACGQRSVSEPYAVGVKNRWLSGDFDHLLLRLVRSRDELHLPESAPSALRALADFFMTRGDVRYEVARRDDLRPFLFELRRTAASLTASIVRSAVPFTRPKQQREGCSASVMS